ncbi:hypothetical protein [Exiguobacterium sp. s133]|uniref:hypothetical protein n=1 Tax=Exiguobacterium sp. s133 TaxID=2751213 RepID=UPI001BEBD1BA|nr:hypothetical protein [Exiguobacterium sp. s133]
MILSKLEAVQLFGSDKQKAHFQKYNRFVNSNLEQSLFKTLQQNFETVDRIKKGRGFEYQVLNKKEQITPRLTKTSHNGSWSIPYTFDLDKIMLIHLTQENISGSIGRVAYDSSIYISDNQFQVTRSFKSPSVIKYIFGETNPYVIEFVTNHIKSIEQEVSRSLSRLHKLGLINLKISYRAVDKSDNTSSNFVELNDELADAYLQKRKDILSEQNISLWFANSSPSDDKSNQYHEKHLDLVKNKISPLAKKDFSASYIYKHYSASLAKEVKDNPVQRYEDLMSLQSDSRDMAELIENFRLARKKHLLKKMILKLEQIAEKEKPEVDEDGDEIPVFRNTRNDLMDIFYDMVIDGTVKKYVILFIEKLFKTEMQQFEETNSDEDVTSNDSSIEFGMTDPSFLKDQLDPPSPYLPMQ